jgi:hypothetical protein
VLTPWGITKGLTLDRLRLGSRTLEQLYAGLNPLGFFAPDNSQRSTQLRLSNIASLPINIPPLPTVILKNDDEGFCRDRAELRLRIAAR